MQPIQDRARDRLPHETGYPEPCPRVLLRLPALTRLGLSGAAAHARGGSSSQTSLVEVWLRFARHEPDPRRAGARARERGEQADAADAAARRVERDCVRELLVRLCYPTTSAIACVSYSCGCAIQRTSKLVRPRALRAPLAVARPHHRADAPRTPPQVSGAPSATRSSRSTHDALRLRRPSRPGVQGGAAA